jgi:hypothetical protein
MAETINITFDITRAQLASFVKDPRTISDLEAFLRTVREEVPAVIAVKVDESRQINTDSTLTGGGDLSADRTLGIDLTAETERVQDILGAALTDTATVDFTYDDTAGTVTASLKNTTVTPGTYGDATHVGQFTVDAQGRLTSASSIAITFPAAGVTTTGSPASGNLAKFSGAGTITSGDLSGDVITSGTLAATIANNAVTYAKMQDVSATKRVLGRNTAGSGDPEEVTVDQLLDWITGTAAQGDVFYRGASGIKRLAAGSSGQVLQTNGAGADPSWGSVAPGAGGSAWALAGSGQTATGVYDFAVDGAKANIDFTGLGSYNELLIIARGLVGSSGVRQLRVSTDNGVSFYSTSGDYVFIDVTGIEASTTVLAAHSTNSLGPRSMIAHIINTKGAAKHCVTNTASGQQSLFVASASDINAVRVFNSAAGNFTAGTVRVYAR